jgi:hypothetical protein
MKALTIVSVFLVLIFAFLWYSRMSDLEDARKEAADAKAAAATAAEATEQRRAELERLSALVGWNTLEGGRYTDPSAVEKNVTQAPDGFWTRIQAAAKVRLPKEFWKGGADAPPPTAFDLAKTHPEFLPLVQELKSARPPTPPEPLGEDATDAEKAEYAAQKAEYDAALATYEQALEKVLSQNEAFAQYVREIGGATVLTSEEPIEELNFYRQPPNLPTRLEAFLEGSSSVDKAFLGMRSVLETTVAANMATIKALREEIAKKEQVITNPAEDALGLREQLQREQAAHTADIARLQAENAELTARAEGFRVEAANAQNELARVRDESAATTRRKDFEIAALRDFQRLQKEQADLAIRRNDEDGRVLDANTALGVAYVDLGSVDRVYAGLKFQVFGVGRGGIRELKGSVMIQEVLGEHYAKATILPGAVGESRPIVRGDTIHNPFYDATKTIHVYLAGDLRKYPKAIAAARLKRANVVIDEQLGAQTDWVVVPESMTAPVEAAPAEEGAEEGAAPAPATATAYDRLRERARSFGATLVTERMLEAFLDY